MGFSFFIMNYIETKYPELIPINEAIKDLTESLKEVTDYEPIMDKIIELQKQRSIILNDNIVILK
jgi:tRNA splicing ligase